MTPVNPLDLSGKTVVVTGASSGIGRATAELLSQLGARLVLVARNRDALEATFGRLSGDGHQVFDYDLTLLDGIPDLIWRIHESVGRIDGLVHSAGLHSIRPLRSIEPEDIHRLFDINVASAVMLVKGFRHKKVRGSDASVVLLSSAVGQVGQSGVSVYSASKGAVLTLAKSLALELARENVRVNAVCPGVVVTEMTDELRRAIGPESFESVENAHPLGLGRAEDVANSVAFLLSDAARWITGSALTVDGGYTAQ